MQILSSSYLKNINTVRGRLGVKESFDIIERRLSAGGTPLTLFYIDGFTKDGEMQRIMQYLLSKKQIGTAQSLSESLPYIEVAVSQDLDEVIMAVLSGQTALFSPTFSSEAVLIDARTYPARNTEEPQGDRVMLGARDGFVETLVMNTALLRRRIRDSRLTMEYHNIGGMSATDVVISYVKGVAKEKDIIAVREHILKIQAKTMTLGTQSLAESIQKSGWFNPFPKFRTTERPDTAAAEVLEGRILIFCDTSPLVMILPSSILDYLEEANDYYFPPLTGTYLRLIRTAILLFSLVVTPIWYLYLEYSAVLPEFLTFLIPSEPGALPIALQLILCELAIDGLKIASMNTPSMLSNSLSVVGGLLLGDFAVSVGWLCVDVIFYMAFVAIANFAQQNRELGYAVKFCRMLLLALTVILGVWGFALGLIAVFILLATNRPLIGMEPYLYPIIPFDFHALMRMVFRKKK